jgi:DNA mismatch repair ATPase MutS
MMDSYYLPLFAILTVSLYIAGTAFFTRWNSSRQRKREAARFAEYQRAWGKPIDRNRDFTLYQFAANLRQAGSRQLDDNTWDDLNLNEVFAYVDRTLTSPGELQLYHMLGNPEISNDVLQWRDEHIEVFQSTISVRERVFIRLSHLSHTPYAKEVVSLLWGELPSLKSFTRMFSIIAAISAAVLCASVVLVLLGMSGAMYLILLPLGLYLINIPIHYRTRVGLSPYLRSIRYICKMIEVSRSVATLNLPGLERISKLLKHYSETVENIPRASVSIVPERSGVFEFLSLIQEYFAILFLVEVRAFYRVLAEIKRHREDLQILFQTFGDLDALLALASFREGLPLYSKPIFNPGPPRLLVDGVYHLLLDEPIANSISIVEKGCLITGSNMSGKSTFLRTLGVTAVLAQTVFTCPANSYRASHFHVLTSMSIRDDLMRGTSYYLAEAQRLLAIIRKSEGGVPTLGLIDEILRGTNTTERIAASREILLYLSNLRGVFIVATHDVDLADALIQNYDTYHFEADINESDIHFDYTLRLGTAHSHSAISLLELLGYPKVIVDEARQRI